MHLNAFENLDDLLDAAANPMSITPYAPSCFKPGKGCTWVNSQ